MKPTQNELTNWAINQINTKYKDDVSLLISISGHALDNDCHGECFDYFVPANENGNKLALTFILDGVGHDLYPRSWNRIENMSVLNEEHTCGLAEAKILYSRSDEDKNRFFKMQENLKENLKDEDFMYKKALFKIDQAMELYRTMLFETKLYNVRMAAGYIAHYLSLSVAYINGTYFKLPLDMEIKEASQLKVVPVNFIENYVSITEAISIEEINKICHMMILSIRNFVISYKRPVELSSEVKNYENLASWYQELSLTWRRIYLHCISSDYERVFLNAIFLQNELNIVKEEFNLKEMDLLGYFDINNLNIISDKSQELEQYIISVIESHGVTLNKYDTLEQFLVKNS